MSADITYLYAPAPAGRQRRYCKVCTLSLVKPRFDLSRSLIFESFVRWLLGKNSQHELLGSARTFRDQTSWCWDVPLPDVLTGEIYQAVVIDGIRVEAVYAWWLAPRAMPSRGSGQIEKIVRTGVSCWIFCQHQHTLSVMVKKAYSRL